MSQLRLRHATPAYRTFGGSDALDALPRELDRLGARRVVLVYGRSMKRATAVLGRVVSVLGDRLAGHFDGVVAHSPVPTVEAARDALAEHRADAVVALGGGSAVVTARAATILLAEQRPVRELCTYRDRDGRLRSPRLQAPKIPNWVIASTPTTAYAKAGSAVRDPATGDRLALYDPKTRAQAVILDPDVALTAPRDLVRSSAWNAFAMTVESLQSTVDNPLAEGLLVQALRLLVRWLPRLDSADGPETRLRLMVAAVLAGQGSDAYGGGLAQALSHAVGPRSAVANGVVEALLLPYVMRFNEPVTGERLANLAEILRATDTNAEHGADPIDTVTRLLRAMGVPPRLRDVGVAQESFPEIVRHALDDWAITQSPRPIDADQIMELLARAW
jgi:alcohol dehydrogenase class IV